MVMSSQVIFFREKPHDRPVEFPRNPYCSRKQSEKAKVIRSQFSAEVENVNVNVTPH